MSTSREGQRAWASRRRRPSWAPSARAAGERATTRLADTTATLAEGGRPAAMTAQSGQSATSARGGVVPRPGPRTEATTAATGAGPALWPSSGKTRGTGYLTNQALTI